MIEKGIKVDEGVYLKKGSNFFGWRLVFPIKNEDGTINWFNLLTGGSWANVIWTALIVGVLIGLIFLYKHDIATITAYYEKLCDLNVINPFS